MGLWATFFILALFSLVFEIACVAVPLPGAIASFCGGKIAGIVGAVFIIGLPVAVAIFDWVGNRSRKRANVQHSTRTTDQDHGSP